MIRDLRHAAGLNQMDIARALGLDRSTVGKWEQGRAFPRCEHVPKLARILGCTIDQLYEQVDAGKAG